MCERVKRTNRRQLEHRTGEHGANGPHAPSQVPSKPSGELTPVFYGTEWSGIDRHHDDDPMLGYGNRAFGHPEQIARYLERSCVAFKRFPKLSFLETPVELVQCAR